MKRTYITALLALTTLLGLTLSLACQAQKQPGIIIPPSNLSTGLGGQKVGRTFLMINLNKPKIGKHQDAAGNFPYGYAPYDLWAAYNIPDYGGGGAGGAIAVVDAYHYPTALNDFNVYAQTFGLPLEPSSNPTASTNRVFQVVYANGRPPLDNGGWNVEAALDIEISHAMAPHAKVYLVEARSQYFSDLFAAVRTAASLPGVRQVSMSWGVGEAYEEVLYDLYFQVPGVVFVASTGDSGSGTQYPSASPYVVAAGGTSLYLDANDNRLGEIAWSGSGGGPSLFEPIPNYQVNGGLAGVFIDPFGTDTQFLSRGVPDVSLDADPNTGVAVFVSTPQESIPIGTYWIVVGGTSLAAPGLAGIINNNASFYGAFDSTNAELNWVYGLYNSPHYGWAYHDITVGFTGYFNAVPGWDFTTGVGTPNGFGSL